MIDNEYQLLRKQARIDRMAYVTRAADTVIDLKVPVVVPCDSRQAITITQLQFAECIRKLFRARNGLSVSAAMPGVVSCDRHNLTITMVSGCVFCDR